MVVYNSKGDESVGETPSSSTASWIAHRSYLAPTTLKRQKYSESLNNVKNNLTNLSKISERGYKNINNQTTGNFNYNFNDEYDPRYPNDYEKVSKIFSLKFHTKTIPIVSPKEEEKTHSMVTIESSSPNEPEQRLSGDEMLKRRLEAMEKSELYTDTPLVEATHIEQIDTNKTQLEKSEIKKGQPIALKMMEKMGWKEGTGLGKNEQGIITPLIAKSTGKNSGIIVNALPKSKFIEKVKEINEKMTSRENESDDVVKSRVSLIVFYSKKKIDLEELEELTSEYGTLVDIKLLDEKQMKVIYNEQECSEIVKRHPIEDCQFVICEYETEEQSKRLISSLDNTKVMESQVNIHYLPLVVYNKL